MVDFQACGPFGAGGIFPRLVGDDDDASCAFRCHFVGDLHNRDITIDVLPPVIATASLKRIL